METTEDTKTLGLGVEEIIAQVNSYCDEKGISLIKLCNDHGLNPDLLYRMKRGGPANPTLRNINDTLYAIGKRIVIQDIPKEAKDAA